MIVIADDITGAAEIAGIAHSRGMGVRLFCGLPPYGPVDCGTVTVPTALTVIATDTRSMTEAEAAAEITQWGRFRCVIFKKTDSALRGHVVAELAALMQASGYRRAVYLPANPSKGRVIRACTYYIYNKPIHETDFRFDPEFPARTSNLRERFPDAAAHNILMPDAESLDDIRRTVQQYDDGHTLFAGAADLFTAMLDALGQPTNPSPTSFTSPTNPTSSTLILCGSTQSRALDIGIESAPMPRAIYDGSDDLTLWDTTAYDNTHSLILTIPHTHRTGKAVAVHLRTIMARMARRLTDRHRPDHLIIEGGATAWATLQSLGWTEFEIVRQIAPGVVQMRASNGTLVTLKPGSYPWGDLWSFGSSSNLDKQ